MVVDEIETLWVSSSLSSSWRVSMYAGGTYQGRKISFTRSTQSLLLGFTYHTLKWFDTLEISVLINFRVTYSFQQIGNTWLLVSRV